MKRKFPVMVRNGSRYEETSEMVSPAWIRSSTDRTDYLLSVEEGVDYAVGYVHREKPGKFTPSTVGVHDPSGYSRRLPSERTLFAARAAVEARLDEECDHAFPCRH